MNNTKLLIVYSANSPAAEFVLQGVNIKDVNIQKLQINESVVCKILYYIFYKMNMFKCASFFRFKSSFRKIINKQRGTILFWDCCDLFLYQLLESECNHNVNKSIFFWNPLGMHKTEKVSVDIMIKWLKNHDYSLSTFDPDDSLHYGIQLYCNVNRKIKLDNNGIDYDFYFVGLPKGREAVLNKLKDELLRKGYRIKFIIPQNRNEYVSQIQNIIYSSKSKCIIDLISDKYGQSGLTLRPFDALFLKKKLLTNCKSIVKYDFYHVNNNYVLSDDINIDGIEKFLTLPYQNIDDNIINKYEINHWLKKYYLS